MLPFTGIVVTYNEASRLRACLESLRFCDQLVVVDLGSTDNSIAIATEYNAEVHHHPLVPVVEQVLETACSFSRNKWIIRLDPDEVFAEAYLEIIRLEIMSEVSLAILEVPFQNYFLGRKLDTTFWGGIHYKRGVVFNRERVKIIPHVHRCLVVREGFSVKSLQFDGTNAFQHYWIDSYSQLFEKHRRYIKTEGEARYCRGMRFSWVDWAILSYRAFKSNLIDLSGRRGGFDGVFLSFFYAWYECMSLLSLRKYQRAMERRTG